MIKLLFSGTSDGFYPRFASDGILNDDVSLRLLDRRRLLSRDDGRLFREGYSFQPLAGLGILFHKIMLLYDGFGRDGFVMASLFLPEGDMLSGKEIKESLDFLIMGYKACLGISGMATFDIDWSFVRRKADELNGKVQSIIWKNHPGLAEPSSTALIKGAGGMVSEYFQYPNPLNRSCGGFEQVFLTESILNPSMVSDNVEAGYKVLTTQDVDITNPEYVIEYTNEQEGGVLDSQRKTITKQELTQSGNIDLGTYRKPGYRNAEVTIGESDKVSRDGVTIQIPLPTLVLKKAVMRLEFIDTTTKRVSSEGLSIKWSNASFHEFSPQSIGNEVYSFEGKCCDAEWTLTVESGLYEKARKSVVVLDSKDETVIVELVPFPLWNIIIVLPDGSSKLLFSAVPQKDLDYYIQQASNYPVSIGMDGGLIQAAPVTKDTDNHTATIVFKKKEIGKVVSGQSGEGEKGRGDDQPEVKKYYLHLDDKSRNYPLFRNYRKKIELSKRLEDEITLFNQLRESSNLSDQVRSFTKRFIAVIDAPKPDVKAAQLIFESAAKECSERKYWDHFSKSASRIIDYLKKKESISDVVSNPEDVVYDSEHHRLEWTRTKTPSSRDCVYFGRDLFLYKLSTVFWDTDPVGAFTQKSQVKKVLLKKYRTLFFVICPVVLIALMLIMFFVFGNGVNRKVTRFEKDVETVLKNPTIISYSESYCGDELYQTLKQLDDVRSDLVAKKPALSEEESFKQLEGLCNKQSELKRKDSLIYHQANELLASVDLFDENKWNELWVGKEVLTQEHRVYLEGKHREIIEKFNAQQADEERKQAEERQQKAIKEESDLYNKCFTQNSSFNDYMKYLETYSSGDKKQYSSNENRENVKVKFKNASHKFFELENNPVDKLRNALELYKTYFPLDEKEIDSFRQIIEKKEKEEEEQRSSRSTRKETIRDYSGLFEKLTWANIKDGQGAFEDSFEIVGNNKKIMRDYLRKVIDAASDNSKIKDINLKKVRYEKAYSLVYSNQSLSPTERFDELIDELNK